MVQAAERGLVARGGVERVHQVAHISDVLLVGASALVACDDQAVGPVILCLQGPPGSSASRVLAVLKQVEVMAEAEAWLPRVIATLPFTFNTTAIVSAAMLVAANERTNIKAIDILLNFDLIVSPYS